MAQITDLHLLEDRQAELFGCCTYSTFSKTIDAISSQHIRPDLCVLTGDISQDGTVASYELARSELERLDMPVFWIPGNHDDPDKATAVFEQSSSIHRLTKLATGSWDFIYLDTCRAGVDHGHLSDLAFDRFTADVEASTLDGKHVAIVMHHHPVPTQTPLIDAYILQDEWRLLTLLDEHPNVKLVICGHVHGDYQLQYGTQMIEMCPSTCFQWERGTTVLKTENWRGYKLLEFSPSGYQATLVTV
ncbi:metallophosphoesterase [Ralstonia nicotianae]